ncbi:MAG: hypothetical protein GY869_23555, partial [Planctomycetes bacterium]|nr:hypothetical protein [Planctomycetota bacterium]
NVARSQTDIQNNMHTTLSGAETGQVAYYRFDETGGAILPDLTSNNNNGTLTNMDNADWVISEAIPPFLKPASNVTSTGFKANWHPVSSATGYRVDVSTDPNFGSFITNGQDIAAGNDSTFSVTGLALTAGTQYYYRLRAVVDTWTSPNSAAQRFWVPMIRPGNALDFDGSNDYVSLSSPLPAMTELTIETWLYLGSDDSYDVIINYDNWNVADVHFQFYSGYLQLALGGNSPVSYVSSYQFSPGIWYHVALVYSTVTMNAILYVNGLEIDSISYTTALVTAVDYAVIGAWNNSGYRDRFFDGQIDEFRLWNMVRSQTDIQNNMHNTLDGDETGLIVYYRFDETSGTILPDLTSNNIDGTLTNMDNADWVTSEAMLPFIKPATNATPTGFTANWHPVSGATGYLVDVDDDPDFSSPLQSAIDAGADTTYIVTGLALTAGEFYYWRMRAQVDDWTSPYSTSEAFVSPMVKPGNALDFDGVNDYVSIPDDPSLQLTDNFTIEFWFKSDNVNQYQKYILGKNNRYAIIYEYVDNTIEFYAAYYPGGTNPRTGSQISIDDTNWHYIVYSYDGATWAGYKDGCKVFSYPTTTISLGTSSANLVLGAADATVAYIDIQLDEVRIWNIGRSQTEIQNNMHNTLVGNETGLVAYYRFDHIDGTTLVDLTPNGHHGTLGNMDPNTDWTESFAIIQPFANDASNIVETGFTANWGAVDDATTYYLDVADGEDFSAIVAGYDNIDVGPDTTYSVTGLNPQTTYFYRVRSEVYKTSLSSNAGTAPLPMTAAGKALDFDGFNDKVIVPGFSWPTPGGNVTVEFWNKVNTADVRHSSAFFAGSGYDVLQAHVPWSDNILYWDYGTCCGTNGRINTDYTAYLDKWTHVALVSEGEGGSFKAIYLDGVLVSSSAGSTSDPNITLNGLNIGGYSGNSYLHRGQIDEFRIWNYVRSEAEIRDWMCRRLVGDEAGLVAYYRFDQTSGSTLVDLSGNGHNGALRNMDPTADWIVSGAAIGDASSYDYLNATKTVTLAANSGDDLTAIANGPMDGLQVYRVDTGPNVTDVSGSG